MNRVLLGETRLTPEQAKRLNAAQLAYMGDAVYSLFARAILLTGADYGVNQLHRKSVAMVNCKSQAAACALIAPSLDEKESEILRRGRNAKTHAPPKNADPADYKQATALEALMGYLYLTGQDERIEELMHIIFESYTL